MTGSPDCVECQLEQVLKARSGEIRHELRMMNPNTDPNYDRAFQALIYVDTDLRMLRGGARKAGR
jgi:hypothetical protein